MASKSECSGVYGGVWRVAVRRVVLGMDAEMEEGAIRCFLEWL